ncbi:MAG: Helix-turn-helix, AraC domain protein [Flavisolibacter sp.]|nr:Helix-turn-helix, AraC domain protein [Flavisolibacter sp.]
MLQSLQKMKISKHSKSEQAIVTDNPYKKAVMRYRKLDEGLWLLATSLDVKQNIVSKALYHKAEPSLYYFLSFAVFNHVSPISSGNNVRLVSTTCTFYKPNTNVETYFFEGTNGIFYNLAFTKDWAQKNCGLKIKGEEKASERFLDGHPGFINLIDGVPDAEKVSKAFWQYLESEENGELTIAYLKKEVTKIISGFFKTSVVAKRMAGNYCLHNSDYAKVAAAEKMLLLHLSHSFIGIEKVARAVHVSPTKIKAMFKAVFGFSMLQYHKEKNMLLAKQLLAHDKLSIKEIAFVTGYSSASKFSAAFKKRFGLPSHFIKPQ